MALLGRRARGRGGGDASIKNLIGLWVGLGEAGGGEDLSQGSICLNVGGGIR